MSVSAALLQALAEEGLDLAAAIRVAARVEASEAAERMAKEEAKRAGNAERQRRFKVRRKAAKEEEGNAGNASNALPPSPNDIYSNPLPAVSNETERSRAPAKPEGVDDQVWEDFKRLRAKQKATITPTVLTGFEREARKAGWSMNDALRECVERSWRGFKAEWVEKRTGPAKQNRDPPSFLEHLTEERKRREEYERRQSAA